MKKILFASLSLAALSLAAAIWWLSVRLDSHLATATQSLSDTGDLLDARMEAESARYAALLAAQSAAWRDTADRQASEYRKSLERESAALRGQLVYSQVMHVGPAVADARKLLQDSDALVTKATPQVIGLAAGWKQAGGFSAATIRMVQPDLKVMTTEGAKAAPTLRKTAENVERITRPPNIFVRIFGPIVKLLF